MIVLRLAGGLGNQMFQYAFGRAAANRLGVKMVLDVSDPTLSIHQGFELNKVFSIRAEIATESDMRDVLGWRRPEIIRKALRKTGLASIFAKKCIDEPHFHFSSEMLHVSDGAYLCGYWQSEKYFKDAAECIRDEFEFRAPPSGVNKELAQEIAGANSTAISLHVRRGDYMHNHAVSRVLGGCSLDYYRLAIQHVVEHVQNPMFYVFSDDMDWVRTNLDMPFPYRLVAHNRGESSYEDMRLMSLCKHHIIANSSFSWWGAWLNLDPDKVVVAPQKWFAIPNKYNTDDLLPDSWIRL